MTMILVGVMGTGKSSLAGILSLSNKQRKVPVDEQYQAFAIGGCETAKTTEVSVLIIPPSEITNDEYVRLVDTPGLADFAVEEDYKTI